MSRLLWFKVMYQLTHFSKIDHSFFYSTNIICSLYLSMRPVAVILSKEEYVCKGNFVQGRICMYKQLAFLVH